MLTSLTEPFIVKALRIVCVDVYICGGYDGADIFDDLWSLNLRNMCWRKHEATMPEPAYFIDTAITQVKLCEGSSTVMTVMYCLYTDIAFTRFHVSDYMYIHVRKYMHVPT